MKKQGGGGRVHSHTQNGALLHGRAPFCFQFPDGSLRLDLGLLGFRRDRLRGGLRLGLV